MVSKKVTDQCQNTSASGIEVSRQPARYTPKVEIQPLSDRCKEDMREKQEPAKVEQNVLPLNVQPFEMHVAAHEMHVAAHVNGARASTALIKAAHITTPATPLLQVLLL